jgi:ABC-2 type transport system permease protein
LRARFQGSRYFDITAYPQRDAQIRELLDRGEVVAAVYVLPGFGRDVLRGQSGAVQVLVDGTNSNTAAIVSSYARQIIAAYGQTGGRLNVQSRVWFNPELESRDYFVPGVVVNIIALVTVMLTAMSIVREKEIGTMEQLMVTPIRPIELMIGKLLPFAAIGLFEVGLVTSAAMLVFDTPLRGSVVLLFGAAILFLLTTLGAGLFISTISHTQQQAMMSSFFFFLPAMLLSGFAFPIRSMPAAVQFLTYVNPLRYFMDIVRGIFLKGTGLAHLWPQLAALLAIGTAALLLSAARFRKRLD